MIRFAVRRVECVRVWSDESVVCFVCELLSKRAVCVIVSIISCYWRRRRKFLVIVLLVSLLNHQRRKLSNLYNGEKKCRAKLEIFCYLFRTELLLANSFKRFFAYIV